MSTSISIFSKYKKNLSMVFTKTLYQTDVALLASNKKELIGKIASVLGHYPSKISLVILGKIFIINPDTDNSLKPLFITEQTFSDPKMYDEVSEEIKAINSQEQELEKEIQHALAFVPNALFMSKTVNDIYALIPSCFHPILDKVLPIAASDKITVSQEDIDNYQKQYDYYINKAKIKLSNKFLLGETI